MVNDSAEQDRMIWLRAVEAELRSKTEAPVPPVVTRQSTPTDGGAAPAPVAPPLANVPGESTGRVDAVSESKIAPPADVGAAGVGAGMGVAPVPVPLPAPSRIAPLDVINPGALRFTPTPTWAIVVEHRRVPIDLIDPSPFRARLPDESHVRAIAESLRAGVHPIPPVHVRAVRARYQQLDAHSLIDACRRHLNLEDVEVIVVDLPDDLQAAYWVIGSNRATRRETPWEVMRAVGRIFSLTTQSEKRTQREISQRTGWDESTVSEAKHWAKAISPEVLQLAGVDEAEHASRLLALRRSDLRYIRSGPLGCKGPDEDRKAEKVAERLSERVFAIDVPAATESFDPSGRVRMGIIDGDWEARIRDLGSCSGAEVRAICQHITAAIVAKHKELR
jgi:hypothetical protein